MRFIEPFFAFYYDDFMLVTVLKRAPWPKRAAAPGFNAVRRLSVQEADRNTRMWSKLDTDAAYRELCQQVWAQDFNNPPKDAKALAESKRKLDEQIERTVTATAKLRERGVPVVFVRPPSDGEYYKYEQREYPRATTWDVLLQKTGAPGIHFEDHPELQGLTLPEWSHLSAADAERFTDALCRLLERDHGWTAFP